MADYLSKARALLIKPSGELNLDGALYKAVLFTNIFIESKNEGKYSSKDFTNLILEYFSLMNKSFVTPYFNKKIFIESLERNNFFKIANDQRILGELEQTLKDKGLTGLEFIKKYGI
jgi:hypothetical protein